jgi:hypothetical protein
MTKRITADHVKLERAYEPVTANDRRWARGSGESIPTGRSRRTVGWIGRDISVFPAGHEGVATRVAAGKVTSSRLPALIRGLAGLHPSTHTAL